jgi:hypothetical protein
LHVIWANGKIGSYATYDTPIQPGGSVGRAVVITAHLTVTSSPDATRSPTGLHAFWNQISNAGPTFNGTAGATWPSGGRHWDPITGISPTLSASWGNTIAASTGADGSPWVAFTDVGGFQVTHEDHARGQIGVSSCCVYNPGIGVDDRTAAAWLTWYSITTGHAGIYAQRLGQTGAKVRGPILLAGSDTGGNAIPDNQRTTAVGLGVGRPGVYVSYPSGYPVARSVDVIKLGSPTPIVLDHTNGAVGSTLTADPAGRLWVAWYSGSFDNYALFVRRAAGGASSFGPAQRVFLPPGTADLWKVYINAQAGRLDVLALLTVHGQTAYWATQVLSPS